MVVTIKTDIDVSDLLLLVNLNNQKSNLSSFLKRIVADKLFDLCRDCKSMASIPQGAFAACKMRSYNEKEMMVAKIKTNTEKPESRTNFANKKLLEYSPVKYNSKLMNSIWGLYNRYSPHNIKGNDYKAEDQEMIMQQPMAVASYAVEEKLMKSFQSGNEWNFP